MKVSRAILPLALCLAVTACGGMLGGRQVEVTTGPEPAADVAIRFTNNLTQSVNVYLATGGTDIFLKQVAGNSIELLPVRGVPAGTTGTLRARTVDGTRTYTRSNVVLSASYEWRVP